MYLKVSRTLEFKCFHHKKWQLYDVAEVLVDTTVVIELQYLSVWNQYVYTFSLHSIIYVSFISVI